MENLGVPNWRLPRMPLLVEKPQARRKNSPCGASRAACKDSAPIRVPATQARTWQGTDCMVCAPRSPIMDSLDEFEKTLAAEKAERDLREKDRADKRER